MFYTHNFRIGLTMLAQNTYISNKWLLSILQDIAEMHSASIGYGVTDIDKNYFSWALLNWKVKIISRPKYGDTITVKTWARHSKKLYCYFSLLNNELHKYIKSFLLISVISFFEYTFFYTLLGHPYALLLGILSSLSNFVPVVGGLFVQIFAIILSFNISKHMGITVLAITIILGIVDAYIINPLVYGKSSQISPLIIIISIFLFGELFGFIGIVFALPIAIVIMHTYKFFHKDAYV